MLKVTLSGTRYPWGEESVQRGCPVPTPCAGLSSNRFPRERAPSQALLCFQKL